MELGLRKLQKAQKELAEIERDRELELAEREEVKQIGTLAKHPDSV